MKCPECSSTDVEEGAFVLRCFTCGYDWVSTHTCHVCVETAVGCCSFKNEDGWYCREHAEVTRKDSFGKFAAAFLEQA